MGLWGETFRRARYLGRRSQVESELDEEVRFHVETRARELERSGVPRPAALSQAAREFGHATVIREDMREAWQFHWLERLRRDLAHAVRSLARTPAFALGAERAHIQGLVLRQALTLAFAGIAIGIVAALMLTSLAGSMLYKTGARDPLTFVLAPLIFLAVALLAGYLPARRATKVDPMEALR